MANDKEQELSNELDETIVSIASSLESDETQWVWDRTYDLIDGYHDDGAVVEEFNAGVRAAIEKTDDERVLRLLVTLDSYDIPDGSKYNAFHELSDAIRIPYYTDDISFNEAVMRACND